MKRPSSLTIASRPLRLFSPKGFVRKVVETVTGTERYATHRSLLKYTLNGLRKINHRPICDPVLRSSCSDRLIVMGFNQNLPWAIHARRSGRVRFLAMGPPMANANRAELLRFVPVQAWIDTILNPSEYYRLRCCEEAPELAHLFTTWSCGVDVDYWSPAASCGVRNRVLVYQKNAPDEIYRRVLDVLSRLPFELDILPYGSYTATDYKRALQGAFCAVFLSKWESQGVALAEAWACDVPTFVWRSDATSTRPYSAPLLTEATGRIFHEPSELSHYVSQCSSQSDFRPREWVINNLTEELQARRLLQICGIATE